LSAGFLFPVQFRQTMAVITSIELQTRGKRVTIYADGLPWAQVDRDVVLEHGLRRGDAVGDALLEELGQADEQKRAYESALLLLSYRARAAGELEQRLRRKGYGDEAIASTMHRLQNAGLIDDARFSKQWVAGRSGASGRGAAVIRNELRAKGVDATTIAETVPADDPETALAVVRARAARLPVDDYQEFRRRLGSFLQRRGFAYDVIRTAVRDAWNERTTTDEAE
jgi:regulatory protein